MHREQDRDIENECGVCVKFEPKLTKHTYISVTYISFPPLTMESQGFNHVQLWTTGVVQTVVCVLGILGNSTTLFILNASKEMRKQPINVYLTVLALYDNGVLFNAILMLCIPNIYKLLSSFQSGDDVSNELLNNTLADIAFRNETTMQSNLHTHMTSALTVQLNSSDGSESFIDYGASGVFSNFNHSLLDESLSANSTNNSMAADMSGQDPLHLYIGIVYPLALFSQTGSVWTTCLITAVSSKVYALLLKELPKNSHENSRAALMKPLFRNPLVTGAIFGSLLSDASPRAVHAWPRNVGAARAVRVGIRL